MHDYVWKPLASPRIALHKLQCEWMEARCPSLEHQLKLNQTYPVLHPSCDEVTCPKRADLILSLAASHAHTRLEPETSTMDKVKPAAW